MPELGLPWQLSLHNNNDVVNLLAMLCRHAMQKIKSWESQTEWSPAKWLLKSCRNNIIYNIHDKITQTEWCPAKWSLILCIVVEGCSGLLVSSKCINNPNHYKQGGIHRVSGVSKQEWIGISSGRSIGSEKGKGGGWIMKWTNGMTFPPFLVQSEQREYLSWRHLEEMIRYLTNELHAGNHK